jgi:hypothetical protein
MQLPRERNVKDLNKMMLLNFLYNCGALLLEIFFEYSKKI